MVVELGVPKLYSEYYGGAAVGLGAQVLGGSWLQGQHTLEGQGAEVTLGALTEGFGGGKPLAGFGNYHQSARG
jgi:hypothetical protein